MTSQLFFCFYEMVIIMGGCSGVYKMTREELVRMIRKFPDKPGVYLMHDKDGKTIYIGKAKSLKKRVSSYFRRGSFASPRLARLVDDIADAHIAADAVRAPFQRQLPRQHRHPRLGWAVRAAARLRVSGTAAVSDYGACLRLFCGGRRVAPVLRGRPGALCGGCGH